jgi:hypothetical protein
MSDEQRLERIERKLDVVSDAIVSLARVEERMIGVFARIDNLDAQQDKHSGRITILEGSVGSNGQALRFAERVFWIIVSAGIAFAFAKMKGA